MHAVEGKEDFVMAWTFERADTFGEGWTLKALKSGLTAGRILKGADGIYRFYKGGGGPGTALMQQPLLENADLERLKEAITDLI